MIFEECCDMKLPLSPTNDLGTEVFAYGVFAAKVFHHSCEFGYQSLAMNVMNHERTALINNSNELARMQSRNSLSFPTVKNNLDNMLDDFTNDQFIESLL
jgi:hypothetical protein